MRFSIRILTLALVLCSPLCFAVQAGGPLFIFSGFGVDDDTTMVNGLLKSKFDNCQFWHGAFQRFQRDYFGVRIHFHSFVSNSCACVYSPERYIRPVCRGVQPLRSWSAYGPNSGAG